MKWLENYYIQKLDGYFKALHRRVFVLDASCLIDGRVIGFLKEDGLDGDIIVPFFVLEKLSSLRASSSAVVSGRGRRGVNVFKQLRDDMFKIGRVVSEVKVLNLKVDSFSEKLVLYCKEGFHNVVLITVDEDISKLARAHKVNVVNIADLAQSLQDTIFRGDKYTIKLTRAGKEPGQAIGYLNNAVLVVVKDAMNYLNQSVPVVVTRVLPLDNGEKIVFAELQWNVGDD